MWTWNTCIIVIAHVEVCTDLNKIDLLVLSSSYYFDEDIICDDAKMFLFKMTLVFSACYACENFEMNAVYFVNY